MNDDGQARGGLDGVIQKISSNGRRGMAVRGMESYIGMGDLKVEKLEQFKHDTLDNGFFMSIVDGLPEVIVRRSKMKCLNITF